MIGLDEGGSRRFDRYVFFLLLFNINITFYLQIATTSNNDDCNSSTHPLTLSLLLLGGFLFLFVTTT